MLSLTASISMRGEVFGRDNIHAISLLSVVALIPTVFGVPINTPGVSVIDSFARFPDTSAITRAIPLVGRSYLNKRRRKNDQSMGNK
jgi:hypothetical protein